MSAVSQPMAGIVLYALSATDDEGLAAAAWVINVRVGAETYQEVRPYCVRLTPDEDGWRLALSFAPGMIAGDKAEKAKALRSLPIRRAADDEPCVMNAGAPTLILRRPAAE